MPLAPILAEGEAGGAVIGFSRRHFTVPPVGGGLFRIHSAVDTLRVTGENFDHATGEGGIEANLAGGKVGKLEVNFKVLDPNLPLVLFLRHWKTEDSSVRMRITVDGDDELGGLGGAVIERHIDSKMISGGSENVTQIVLRSKDFGSYEFFNYLRLGLNRLRIELAASDGDANRCGYVLHSIAVA